MQEVDQLQDGSGARKVGEWRAGWHAAWLEGVKQHIKAIYHTHKTHL